MYATREEMLDRFGEALLIQLTDRDFSGSLSETVLEAALSDASDVIDSYAAGRYRVPLSPVPAPARRWCADIAVYYLHRSGVPEHIRKAYEDAITALKDVAKGVVLLQSAGLEAAAPAQSGGGLVQSAGPDRLFTATGLKGF